MYKVFNVLMRPPERPITLQIITGTKVLSMQNCSSRSSRSSLQVAAACADGSSESLRAKYRFAHDSVRAHEFNYLCGKCLYVCDAAHAKCRVCITSFQEMAGMMDSTCDRYKLIGIHRKNDCWCVYVCWDIYTFYLIDEQHGAEQFRQRDVVVVPSQNDGNGHSCSTIRMVEYMIMSFEICGCVVS